MKFKRYKIIRDTNTVYNRPVAPWELPVLELVFDEGNVQETDQVDPTEQTAPDPAVEFDRLTRAYGEDPQTHVPYASIVYGSGNRAVANLKRAIKEAFEESDDEAAAPAPKARKRKTTEVADALLG